MSKNEIRKKIFALREKMDPDQVRVKSQKIMGRLEIIPAFQSATKILFYFSHWNEVSTHDLIERWAERKTVYLPRLVDENHFEVGIYSNSDDLSLNRFGIPEPKSSLTEQGIVFDLILVPGVAFDENGNRLGMGKGYYDRFLVGQETALKIGLCYEQQILDGLPKETYDQTVDVIITDERLIKCR